MKTLISLPICALMLSGCATLFSNSSDPISVHSQYSDTDFYVNGNRIGTGSAIYQMPRGTDAIITAKRDGCSDTSVPVTKTATGATFANILFWPGFIVDAATGDMNKPAQTDMTIDPSCKKEAKKPNSDDGDIDPY